MRDPDRSARRFTHSALVSGAVLGAVFGLADLLMTWYSPLDDDTPGALLRFYGPMFFVWAVISYRAARITGPHVVRCGRVRPRPSARVFSSCF